MPDVTYNGEATTLFGWHRQESQLLTSRGKPDDQFHTKLMKEFTYRQNFHTFENQFLD